jgi:DNA-directed RNA polymerase III subunit RPC3
LQRYARYLEYIQKAADPLSAGVVETLLLAGRLRTVDVVALTVAEQADDLPKSDRYTLRQTVVDAFLKLVQGGFLEKVRPFDVPPAVEPDADEGETEFDDHKRPAKRVKIEVPEPSAFAGDEDPAVVTLLQSQGNYKATLPLDAVWRVNHAMFHDTLRAFCLGRLVSERYGQKVQSAGSLVTAALKFRAHQEHARVTDDDAKDTDLQRNPEWKSQFRSDDIKQWLPKPVLQNMEKKAGGVDLNLSKAWQELLELEKPVIVRRVGSDQYEIAHQSLLSCLRERVMHQIVHDRHGEVAARMISILSKQGWLESEALAVQAMVPAKDTREFLHQLYRSHYLELFQVSSSRQHNPAATIYLWKIHEVRLLRQVTENVALALWNIRLRREHEVEIGKGWIERAHRAEDTDENEVESDRLNFEKFRLGLERLDCAAQQLDETLLVLQDF